MKLFFLIPLLAVPHLSAAQKPAPIAPKPSYSRDVVPILRTACIGCHGEQNPAGSLSLTSYMALIKGGKNGAAVTPGKGADSRIVKMLLGTIQPKMPPSGGGLKQVDIDKIRLWIDAGAKVDAAPDPASGAGRNAVVKPAASVAAPSSAPIGKVISAAAPVSSLAFSPDGKVLAVGTYREVQFWNPETRVLQGVWKGHAEAVRSLAFSKDGKWLIAGGRRAGRRG
jgi:FOG: WD40 repeat